MHALVVDDSRANVLALSNLLKSFGAKVDEAASAIEALQAIGDGGKFDIILSDWSMPGMDGVQFAREIRKKPLYGNVPIIMISSNNSVELVQRALEAGINEFIMKPVTREILTSKLEILGVNASEK